MLISKYVNRARLEDLVSHPSSASSGMGLRESVSDCFNVFNGIILYLDPRMREMMQDYQSRLDQIGVDTNCNIYLGNRDLFWLNDFQLGMIYILLYVLNIIMNIMHYPNNRNRG